ncbi:MAG: nucleotidyltransferase domain-containing protein [Ferruginibacter sp.]
MTTITLPKEKKELLDRIVDELKTIDNIKAIVLGGSYATGSASATSDLDVGIYYSQEKPFDIDAIRKIAQKYAADNKPTVTGFYEWGPWVNGGAWIQTSNGKADFLYKNIDQITATIEKAKEGIWENHFEQQPPYGFSSIIYLAETHSCVALWDPEGIIKKLKIAVQRYPVKLKQSVVQQSLWAAEFTIWQAISFAEKKDIYNTVGCLARAVKNIVTALFAINELYPMGDKRAVSYLEKANSRPGDLARRVKNILCVNSNKPADNVALLKVLWTETTALVPGLYQPYYNLWGDDA